VHLDDWTQMPPYIVIHVEMFLHALYREDKEEYSYRIENFGSWCWLSCGSILLGLSVETLSSC
jgi:hypothetical protein